MSFFEPEGIQRIADTGLKLWIVLSPEIKTASAGKNLNVATDIVQ